MNRSRLRSLILVSLVTILVGGGFAFAAPKQARADALGDFISRLTLGDFIRSLFGLPPAGGTITPTPALGGRGLDECQSTDECAYGKCCNTSHQCITCTTHPAPTTPTPTPPGGLPTDIPPHPATNTPVPPGSTNTPVPPSNTPRPQPTNTLTPTVTFRPTITPRPLGGDCTQAGAKRCESDRRQVCERNSFGELRWVWHIDVPLCEAGCVDTYPRCNSGSTGVQHCSGQDEYGCCTSVPFTTECSEYGCRDGRCVPTPTGSVTVTQAPSNTPVPNVPTVTTGPGTPSPTPAPTNTPVPNPTSPPGGGGGSTPVPTQPPVNTPFPTDTPTPLYSSFNAWFADFLPYISGTGGTSTSLTVLEDWRNNAPLP